MNDRFSADDLPMRPGFSPRSPWQIDLARVRPFRLGSVEVRPASRELVGGHHREVLEPRVMQVLVALARAGGEIMSRDDLIACCWDGRAVSDDAINRVLSRLRALARTFEAFQVETITKVGYRLVEQPGGKFPGVPSLTEVPAVDRRLLIAGGGAAVALGAAGVWLLNRPNAETADPEVQRLMAQGRAAMRLGKADDMARAAALYRRAIDRDPGNALAWGRLALVYRFQWEFGTPENAPAMAARVKSAAARALELDPSNVEATAALAMLSPIYGHWVEAEAAMRRILPKDVLSVNIRLARLLSDTGRSRDALELIRQAVATDPEIPRTWNFLGNFLWDSGRLEEAEKVLLTGLSRWPRQVLLWFSRFYFLAFTGRAREAIAFAADLGGRPIGIPDQRFELAIAQAQALAMGGRTHIADAVALSFELVPEGAVYAFEAIVFFAAIGRLDDAFQVADAYYFGRGPVIADIRFPQTGAYMPSNGRECAFLFSAPAAALRTDPRFNDLVREIGLEDYWRQTGTAPDYRRLT